MTPRIPDSALIVLLLALAAAAILRSDTPATVVRQRPSPLLSWRAIAALGLLNVPLYAIYAALSFDQRLACLVWLSSNTGIFLWIAYKQGLESPPPDPLGISRRELAALLALVAVAFAFMASAIGSSSYFLWGDEGEFASLARSIARGDKRDVLWGLGGFAEHPAFASVPAAISMRILGDGIFAFRAEAILTLLASAFPLYIAARMWCGRGAACFCVLSFCFNVGIQSFGMTGYNNSKIVPVLAATLCFSSIALKRGSTAALWLAGASAALGFYLNYFAYIFPLLPSCVPVLGWLSRRHSLRHAGKLMLIAALGFVTMGLPMLANIQLHLQKALVEHAQAWTPGNRDSKLPNSQRMAMLIGKIASSDKMRVAMESILCPVGFRGNMHYNKSARWFDCISGALFSLGLFTSILAIARGELDELLLLAALLSICLGIASTTPYKILAATRGIVLIPLCMLYAARGAQALLSGLAQRRQLALGLSLGAASICLNLNEILAYRGQASINPRGIWPSVQATRERGLDVLLISDQFSLDNSRFIRGMYGWESEVSFLNPSGIEGGSLEMILGRLRPDRIFIEVTYGKKGRGPVPHVRPEQFGYAEKRTLGDTWKELWPIQSEDQQSAPEAASEFSAPTSGGVPSRRHPSAS